jgi:hypothetical protein
VVRPLAAPRRRLAGASCSVTLGLRGVFSRRRRRPGDRVRLRRPADRLSPRGGASAGRPLRGRPELPRAVELVGQPSVAHASALSGRSTTSGRPRASASPNWAVSSEISLRAISGPSVSSTSSSVVHGGRALGRRHPETPASSRLEDRSRPRAPCWRRSPPSEISRRRGVPMAASATGSDSREAKPAQVAVRRECWGVCALRPLCDGVRLPRTASTRPVRRALVAQDWCCLVARLCCQAVGRCAEGRRCRAFLGVSDGIRTRDRLDHNQELDGTGTPFPDAESWPV